MFQNIYLVYCDTKNKEEGDYSMLLTSMAEHEQGKKQNNEVESHGVREKINLSYKI